MIWTWFEEDDLLSEMGYPHLHTDKVAIFLKQYFWNLLIRRMDLEYIKFVRDHKQDHSDYTVFIEFSRGKEHGGYREAFKQISASLAQQAAILYINISWEESLRKTANASILKSQTASLSIPYRMKNWPGCIRKLIGMK